MGQRKQKAKPMLQTALMREVEIENPYYAPSAPAEQRRVKAWQSLRDDPLGLMHHRKQISESQYRAGRAWQALWAASEVGGIKVLDLTQTPVDASPRGFTGISDRQRDAMRDLAKLKTQLGDHGSRLVEAVLVNKRSIREIADTGGNIPTRYNTAFYGHRFRECLDTIAKWLGLSNK